MSIRKRVSLRRWKARCRIGRKIPALAIVEHKLDRWFVFGIADVNRDFATAYAAFPRST